MLFLILNLSVMNASDSKVQLEEHFNDVSDAFVRQAVNTSKIILASKNKQQQQQLMQGLTESDAVAEALLYDSSGQLIAHSENFSSVNELYGIAQGSKDTSNDYVAFTHEIRDQELQGYLRLNVVREVLIKPLEKQLFSQNELFRIMLIFAVAAGFLLTRGSSRFSRQGLRLAKKK
ncbi:AhpA/YtjB family protein [Thalassomonas sp. M1454]|uniref:AhpA/YtjB family protein n=1 Tax=Thalassomonas sp. M1454 TaxID=2594477 RepID=UPI00163D7993|nr:AhpA/YtjB family protein [Thalassomonas sp. M1454]